MKKTGLLFAAIGLLLMSCQNKPGSASAGKNKDLAAFFDRYYETRLKLYPLEATSIGDNRYNDQLPDDGSAAFLSKAKAFYADNLQKIKQFKREDLNAEDQLSYDIFTYEMQVALDGFNYHFEYLPFNQFYALPITIGQFGSGIGSQSFKTVQDYQNWLKRLQAFSVWSNTAIKNLQKGVDTGMVLPRALVMKMIPQMRAMEVTDPTKSLFYGPVNNFPKSFSDTEKSMLKEAYRKAIMQAVVPTYKKLGDYLQNQYLPHARSTSGYSAMTGGAAMYKYLVKQQTTTDKTPEEIYQLGLKEVARIRVKMDSIKNSVGFKGDLKAFFEYMKNDRKFMPYKTPQQVLAAFEDIHKRMEPNLKKMFNHVPKTPFEIRQTEAFRAASASAEYNQGSADGSRPGIFYVPILDASTFNTTSGMESLFLHEAIPGHHYQISLT